MNRRTRLALALVAAGLALAGCAGNDAASTGHDHGPVAVVSGGTSGPYKGVELPDPYQRPSFVLADTSGRAYDFAAQTKGRPTLLFFGYTNCPDVCPTTLADVAVALRDVPASVAKQVQVVFVTTDPRRDTSPVLRAWLDRFDTDLPVRFVGLTGGRQDLEGAQRAAGVPVAQDDGQTHSALLLLYGPDDQAHVAFDTSNGAEDIAHDLRLVAAD